MKADWRQSVQLVRVNLNEVAKMLSEPLSMVEYKQRPSRLKTTRIQQPDDAAQDQRFAGTFRTIHIGTVTRSRDTRVGSSSHNAKSEACAIASETEPRLQRSPVRLVNAPRVPFVKP